MLTSILCANVYNKEAESRIQVSITNKCTRSLAQQQQMFRNIGSYFFIQIVLPVDFCGAFARGFFINFPQEVRSECCRHLCSRIPPLQNISGLCSWRENGFSVIGRGKNIYLHSVDQTNKLSTTQNTWWLPCLHNRQRRKERKQQRRQQRQNHQEEEGQDGQSARKRLRREVMPSSLRLVVDCSFNNLMLIKVNGFGVVPNI